MALTGDIAQDLAAPPKRKLTGDIAADLGATPVDLGLGGPQVYVPRVTPEAAARYAREEIARQDREEMAARRKRQEGQRAGSRRARAGREGNRARQLTYDVPRPPVNPPVRAVPAPPPT